MPAVRRPACVRAESQGARDGADHGGRQRGQRAQHRVRVGRLVASVRVAVVLRVRVGAGAPVALVPRHPNPRSADGANVRRSAARGQRTPGRVAESRTTGCATTRSVARWRRD
ncbi:hypothetical protein GCM10025877_31410 [Agromyces mangrovi Wang et al. 2018]|nr:hypothetical protein GCM10025877_31410 [Agromyces mangrovi]